MAVSYLSVALAKSLLIDCTALDSIITVRSELLGFRDAEKIANKSLTSSLILVISTVEQFSTFGARQTAGSPSHNLDASPTITKFNLSLF